MAEQKGISKKKARQILHEGSVKGKKLTGSQRRFFGAKSTKKKNKEKLGYV